MTTVATPSVPSVPETLISCLNDLSVFLKDKTVFDSPLWFRGVRDSARHVLLPSLYRHPTITGANLKGLEADLMSMFRHRAPPFLRELPKGDFELLFLMQHHGVPTRLLDWTENPYIALFFALENAADEDPARAVDSAVWVLNPILLNKTALTNHTADHIFAIEDELLHGYEPSIPPKNSGKLPVAMDGVHNSPRIVAQRGAFVLFGTQAVAMNNEPVLTAVPGLLHKLVINRTLKKSMRDALFATGITDSVVYPDLDGLGREIKYRLRF
ncbi:MAG: FRG domain-containing protein [Terriglobales bacterium]